jgi:phytanoyl-CoA dioxygenase PhyH
MGLDAREKELWLKEFRLNGFVVLRSFLPKDLVVAMHEQLLPLVRGEYDRIQREKLERLRAPSRLSLDVGRYAQLLGGPIADERYLQNPVIEELVEAILGPSGPWGRGWTQAECVFRGSEYMSWHPDQTDEETPPAGEPQRTVRVTYNVPLVDFTWANGSLEILPSTHLHAHTFFDRSIAEVRNVYPVRLDLSRGDAILRDGNGLHRGTPNLTDEPRIMLDRTYRMASALGKRTG